MGEENGLNLNNVTLYINNDGDWVPVNETPMIHTTEWREFTTTTTPITTATSTLTINANNDTEVAYIHGPSYDELEELVKAIQELGISIKQATGFFNRLKSRISLRFSEEDDEWLSAELEKYLDDITQGGGQT